MPPSTNALFNPHPKFGLIKSAEYRDWEAEVFLTAKKYFSGPRPYLRQHWGLKMTFGFPKSNIWRRDLDNSCKASIDAICKLSGLADRYLISLTVEKDFADTAQVVGVVTLLPTLNAPR